MTVLSAGFVIVRFFPDGPRFLLLRAYRYWDFPKGEVSPGEDALTTARREVFEETGLERLKLRWGRVFTETEPYGRGKVARYYLAESGSGEVRLGISSELGRPEHHEFRWMSQHEARPLLVDRVSGVLDWALPTVSPPA